MATFPEHFERQHQLHLKQGSAARAMRRIGEYFA